MAQVNTFLYVCVSWHVLNVTHNLQTSLAQFTNQTKKAKKVANSLNWTFCQCLNQNTFNYDQC